MTKGEALQELADNRQAAEAAAKRAGKGSFVELSSKAMAFAHKWAYELVEKIDSLDTPNAQNHQQEEVK